MTLKKLIVDGNMLLQNSCLIAIKLYTILQVMTRHTRAGPNVSDTTYTATNSSSRNIFHKW